MSSSVVKCCQNHSRFVNKQQWITLHRKITTKTQTSPVLPTSYHANLPENLVDQMDESFKKLEKEGRNSVDNLVKWVKDSKLIDQSKEAEEKARKLFGEAQDKSKVELSKFKEVVGKLAEEQKKNVADFTHMLSIEGPKFLSALSAAVQAGASAAATASKEAYDNERKKQRELPK